MPIKKLALAAAIATFVILYLMGGGEKYLSIDLYQGLLRPHLLLPLPFSLLYFSLVQDVLYL